MKSRTDLVFVSALIIALLTGASVVSATPQSGQDQEQNFMYQPTAGLVQAVRKATARYQDVGKAVADGYASVGSCVSSPDEGAMGVHYINPSLLGDGAVDVAHPELLVYEPLGNGQLQLVAVEYLTLADIWDAAHSDGSSPLLMGQLFGQAQEILTMATFAVGLLVLAPWLIVLLLINTASALAAIGLGAWLDEHLLGHTALDVQVPLVAFLFLVALGIDYTIFLMHRARAEAVGHGTREGVARAVARTGSVITSAGVVLAAVFAALGVLPLVVLGQLGLIVGLGVLLDTLVVRTLVVPAATALLGERFWWPGRVASRE